MHILLSLLICATGWAVESDPKPVRLVTCEYLLMNRENLLVGARYVHQRLTEHDFELSAVFTRNPQITQELFGFSLTRDQRPDFAAYTLKFSESARGYEAVIAHADKSYAPLALDLPPLLGRHMFKNTERYLEETIRVMELSVDELGNELEEQFGEPESGYAIYLTHGDLPTNLFIHLEPAYPDQIDLGLKLPCSRKASQMFERYSKVRTAEGWFCLYRLLSFKPVSPKR